MYVAPETVSIEEVWADRASDRRMGVARLLIETLFCRSFGTARVVTLVTLPADTVTDTCTGPHRVLIDCPVNVPFDSPEPVAAGAVAAGAVVAAAVVVAALTVVAGVAATAGAVVGVAAGLSATDVGVSAALAATGASVEILAAELVAEVLSTANQAVSAPVADRLMAKAAERLPRAACERRVAGRVRLVGAGAGAVLGCPAPAR